MTLHAPVAILLGIALLLFGRRLFWLFVGAAGFAAGLEAGAELFQGQSELMVLVGAMILGIIGVLLAIFLQKLAIGIAGFVGGAYLALWAIQAFRNGPPPEAAVGASGVWIVVLLGGIVGLVLMLVIFEWALIVLSSTLGAVFIGNSLLQMHVLQHQLADVIIPVLAIVGIVTQAGLRSRRSEEL
jgi:hypothetical protein